MAFPLPMKTCEMYVLSVQMAMLNSVDWLPMPIKVGLKGTVLIDKSKSQHSYTEITDGMRLNVGWTSKYCNRSRKAGMCNGKIRTYSYAMPKCGHYRISCTLSNLQISADLFCLSEMRKIISLMPWNKTMQSRARPIDVAHIASKWDITGLNHGKM